jgi:hypothetical protein
VVSKLSLHGMDKLCAGFTICWALGFPLIVCLGFPDFFFIQLSRTNYNAGKKSAGLNKPGRQIK